MRDLQAPQSPVKFWSISWIGVSAATCTYQEQLLSSPKKAAPEKVRPSLSRTRLWKRSQWPDDWGSLYWPKPEGPSFVAFFSSP